MGDVLLTEEDALERLAGVWRELWTRTRPRPPMLEAAWVRQWWRLHHREGALQILLVLGDDRQPVGLAPLYRRTDRSGPRRYMRTVALLGTGEHEDDEVMGEYNSWLAAPEHMALVTTRVAALLNDAGKPAWDLLRLQHLRPEAGIHEQLSPLLAGVSSGSSAAGMSGFRSPVLPLPAYIAALPSSSFRHRCRRALRAGTEAAVELVRAGDAVEREVMFEALCSLHQKRWTGRGEKGAFGSPVFRAFHRRVVEEYGRADDDRLWLVGLRRQGQWLAVRYLLRAGDALYDYASGVDTETETALAPGPLLHLHTIDLAARAGVRVYDLGAGDQEYKRRLALEESELPTLEVTSRTLRAQIWRAARELRRDLSRVEDMTAPSPAPTTEAGEQPAA